MDLVHHIAKKEGLPHPNHDGQWMKRKKISTSSKLIMKYNKRNFKDYLEVADKAGISCLYHPNIFQSWGHFSPNKSDFPNGMSDLKECVEMAKIEGKNLGAHTLSNFIKKNDKYVTPIPDPRLQQAGIGHLTKDLDKDITEIALPENVDIAAYQWQPFKRSLNAILINKEIIEYTKLSTDKPWRLLGCKRGALGTKKQNHLTGSKVGKLVSHSYGILFGNVELQDEMAKNLGKFFRTSGLERISFDGIEGGKATGHDRYACERFVKVFFDELGHNKIINNSSDLMHYYWHYATNESWGEPWTDDFRKAHLGHRLKSQQILKEELLPTKMGQFFIRENTTVDDIHWVMGLCTGLDSGVDLYIEPDMIKKHKEGEEVLAAIKLWESARMNGLFSEEQKKLLKDPYSLYGLKVIDEKADISFIASWTPAQKKTKVEKNTLPKTVFGTLKHTSKDRQHVNRSREPGEPSYSTWEINNTGLDQALRFSIRVDNKTRQIVRDATIKVGSDHVNIPFTLRRGEWVVSRKGQELKHYSREGVLINQTNIPYLKLNKGMNRVHVDYKREGSSDGPQLLYNFLIKE